MVRALRLWLLGAAFCAAGCEINTDPSIFVDLDITEPEVDVESKALGTVVTGGFTLHVHLGARASGPSAVDVQAFTLVSSDQNTVLLEALPLRAEGAQFPLEVQPNTDTDVAMVIDNGNE